MNNRRYFINKGGNSIWFIDLDINKSFWRTRERPNTNQKSFLTLHEIESGEFGEYLEITKEKANRCCRELFYIQRIKK